MSKAWLRQGRLHLQCDHCHSTGSPGGAQIYMPIPATLRKGYDEFGKKLAEQVQKFQNQTAALRFDTQKTTQQKLDAFTALRKKINEDMAELMKSYPGKAPSPQRIAVCPWCNVKLDLEITEGSE